MRRIYSTRSSKCIVNTGVFFTCMTSSSQSKPAKNTGTCNVLTRQNAKKHRGFETIFHICSARAPQFKNQSFFYLFFCPLSSGLKKVLNRKKMPNCTDKSTFCLSQSLPQSSSSKSWGMLSGPKNAVNHNVL